MCGNKRIKAEVADEQESGNNDFLCDDLLVKILSLLPLKTLFKFKSVCKIWLFTISTILFQRSISFHSRLSGLFRQSLLHSDSVPYIPLLKGVGDENSIIDADLNFLPDHSKSITLDSRNGFLLCCTETDQSTCYYICNPVTRQWILLPKLRRLFRPKFCCGRLSAALVFDSLHPSSHYKVIRLKIWQRSLRNESPTTFLLFDIFSSETGRWTRSKASCDGASRNHLRRQLEFLNGAVYFLPTRQRVIRLHVNEGHWQVILLPPPIQPFSWYPIPDCIGVCEGCLKYVYFSGDLLQVWSLSHGKDNVFKWELKHRIDLRSIDCLGTTLNASVTVMLAFHPFSDAIIVWSNGNVFFFHFPSKRLEMVYDKDAGGRYFLPFSPSLFSLEAKKAELGRLCRRL